MAIQSRQTLGTRLFSGLLLTLICASPKLASAGDLNTTTAERPPANAPTPPDGRFIVHEWGTFTSYSGSDGVRLEYRPLVDNDLPNFVYDWLRWTGMNVFMKRRIRARQRMETPVTYFYTDRLREVDVSVAFPQGVLTEFYPPVRSAEPADVVKRGDTRGVPPESLKNGRLDWGRVTLIPESALRPNIDDGLLADAVARRAFEALPPGGDPEPELYTGDHYYFARNTDSALVHINLPKQEAEAENSPFANFRPSGDFFEKFLFYRGVGNFDLPLTVESSQDGTLHLTNGGGAPLEGLLLVQVTNGELRFSRLDDLAPASTTNASPPSQFVAHPMASTAHAGLWTAMKDILCVQGLYEKEADAMLQTWHHTWFSDEGMRLLYIVPRPLTDELLPLTIKPAPQETVRVLVGRLEILSVSEERRIMELVQANAEQRADYARRYGQAKRLAEQEQVEFRFDEPAPGVPDQIRSLGRFAEPALDRIANITDDAAVRFEANYLVDLLKAL